MKKYILKRILAMIPTLLVVIFIIFALINITPGDPGRIMLGQDAAQEDVDAINAMLRMDKPLLIRYVLYIWDATPIWTLVYRSLRVSPSFLIF